MKRMLVTGGTVFVQPVYCGIFTFRRVRRLCAESEQSGAVCGRKADPGGPGMRWGTSCAGLRSTERCRKTRPRRRAPVLTRRRNMQKKPNYIPFFLDDIDALEPLGDAERGRLFTALLEYGRLGATEKNSGNERLVFPMFKGRRQVFRELRRNVRTERRKREKAVYDRYGRIRW